jgi:hypothetical protein
VVLIRYGVLRSPAMCHWRELVISRFWAVTGDPWYPGYKISTVATKPSIERVVGAVYLTRDRIGTHMLL